MATYTANYGLHQWVPGDNFLRTDFNTDFQKIDAGIKAAKATADVKAEIVTGTYTGDGTQNRLINLGFQPRGVLVETSWGARGGVTQARAGMAVAGGPLAPQDGQPCLFMTSGVSGWVGANRGSQTNSEGYNFFYRAVKKETPRDKARGFSPSSQLPLKIRCSRK